MLLTFSVICLKILAVVSSHFDFNELKNVNYGIEILSTPITLSSDEDIQDPTSLQVTSIHGQSYQCSYINKLDPNDKNRLREEKAFETGIVNLLQPIADGPCLQFTKGWWTYELCHGRTIRQFHADGGRIAGAVTDIGIYESDYDWSIEENVARRKSKRQRYHSQQYNNGSLCDITNNPRQAQVRFLCDVGASADYITSVDEAETCVYVIIVMTPRICSHPYLKPTVVNNIHPITCSPLLTAEEYVEYLDMLDTDKRKEAEKSLKSEVELLDTDYKLQDGKLVQVFKPRSFHEIAETMDDLELTNIMTEALQKALAGVMDDLKLNNGDAEVKMEVHAVEKGSALEDKVQNLVKKHTAKVDGQNAQVGSDLDDLENEDADLEGETDDFEDIDEEDEDFLEEFDRELDSYAKDLNALKNYKNTIESAISSQLEGIVQDAVDELELDGAEDYDANDVDQTAAVRSLSQSLNSLMERLEKAERSYDKADSLLAESIDKYQSEINKLQDELDAEDDLDLDDLDPDLLDDLALDLDDLGLGVDDLGDFKPDERSDKRFGREMNEMVAKFDMLRNMGSSDGADKPLEIEKRKFADIVKAHNMRAEAGGASETRKQEEGASQTLDKKWGDRLEKRASQTLSKDEGASQILNKEKGAPPALNKEEEASPALNKKEGVSQTVSKDEGASQTLTKDEGASQINDEQDALPPLDDKSQSETKNEEPSEIDSENEEQSRKDETQLREIPSSYLIPHIDSNRAGDKKPHSTKLYGQNIEVTVVTTAYIDKNGAMHVLDDDDDDAAEAGRAIFAILGHGGPERKESTKQKELENGYGFAWNKKEKSKDKN